MRGEFHVKANRLIPYGVPLGAALASLTCHAASEVGTKNIKHVLLLSIDGMHAVDFYNCSHGIAAVLNGNAYCPKIQALSDPALNYVSAISSKPSDSFPGLAALVSGGSPRSTGLYYDVAHDRSLGPPAPPPGK